MRAVPAIISVLAMAALSLPAFAQSEPPPPAAPAGDPMAARLSADKVGDMAPGTYSAGDNLNFSVDAYGDKFLLRFAGSPESFVLLVDRVALGGRVLKYDTGTIALRVSVWGGVTLYTEDAPGGLPATRLADSSAGPHPTVSDGEFAAALGDAQSHLAYTQQMKLHFTADAAIGAGGDDARAMAFDALTNAEIAIEKIIATPAGRQALLRRIDSIRIVEGDKPSIALSGKTLLVSFAPATGMTGRASSRAIAYALGKMLSVPEPA